MRFKVQGSGFWVKKRIQGVEDGSLETFYEFANHGIADRMAEGVLFA